MARNRERRTKAGSDSIETMARNAGSISGCTIVTPDETIEQGQLDWEHGAISRVGTGGTRPMPDAIDATGKVVIPGVIDLHGDEIERHVTPRAEATVDPRLAVLMADRENLASGVTTKFHAIAFEDDHDGNRSLESARELTKTIHSMTGLAIDNRVHARCELGCRSAHAVSDLIANGSVDLVSLMNHVPSAGQFSDLAAFRKRYTNGEGGADAHADRIAERREGVPQSRVRERRRQIISLANAHRIPVASHDDDSPEAVRRAAELGVKISEYPLTLEAARQASAVGMATVMGAPNVLRGGSLWDNLDALEAIKEGVVDILCSDYHPASLLGAAFVETEEPLHERVNRITQQPAELMGLADRGRLTPGSRADVVIIDPSPIPTVDRVIIGGVGCFRLPTIATGRRELASPTPSSD